MDCRTHTITVMVVMWLAAVIAGVGQPHARAQEPNRVGLVIDFGNGAIATRCVEFSEPEITGYEVLRRSGLHIVVDEVGGMGVTICDIGQTSGCPGSNCFCKCQGTACQYWSYYRLGDGSWQYSPLGASAHGVHDGEVEGWAWGDGSPSGGAQPPIIPFDQVCASTSAPAPTTFSPTATFPPPTSTGQPAATSTPLRSSTPQLSTPEIVQQAPTPSLSSSSSPTAESTATSLPAPSPTVEPTPTPSSSPTPARATSSPSSSSPIQTMQVASVSSPSARGVPSTSDGQQAASNDEVEPAASFPVRYIIFSLIVGGLLGLLIYILRSEGERA